MNNRRGHKENWIDNQHAARKIAFKRSLVMTCTFAAILGVSGCVEQQGSSEKKPANAVESGDGVKEETNSYVKATETSLPVDDLKKQAFYTTTLTSEREQVKLFVLPVDSGETTVITKDDAGFAGQEGERLYKGKIAFYLAESNGKEGYLQEVESMDHLLNLSQEPFVVQNLDGLAIVQLSESVTFTGKKITLWTVQSGKLVPVSVSVSVSVDGDTSIAAATNDLKIVGDRYIQTYDYFNADPIGWAFRTYEWHPSEAELTLYEETELLVEGPFHYEEMAADIEEFYQSMIDNWNRIEQYTYPFPHMNYPDDLVQRLEKGYILDEEGMVGSSIEKYLEKNPNHLGEYDTEGGWFYAYPDGQSFYFDRGIDNIQAVQLSGGNYKETVSELKKLLGEPLHDSKNDPTSEEDEWLVGTNYDVGDILSYEFGDYQLLVMYRDEKVESILLSEKME